MPLATSTSTSPQVFVTSLVQRGKDSSDVSSCSDHLYMPQGRYSRFVGQKLRCLGKGVMLRAGRATTSYLRNATLGAQAIAVVTKIWKMWDGFHRELYLYGHPHHLRPLQGLCVPSIIGVFSTSEGLANMAMEPPHPHAWRVAERSISMDEKHAIVEAYAQIHARGVLHGDVALRHMLIGRDGKPTIINFRQASCLQPAMQIGLSRCSTDELQLEMRQVKFLLDYQGAREFEYRIAKEWRSVTKMNTRQEVTSISPFPIPENTLQQWDASTLEDLPPPSLPFYIPNAPDISILPVSWIQGDMPLRPDDLPNLDSEENQLHSRTIDEISTMYIRFDQTDDHEGDMQPPPARSSSLSSLKGKQPEHVSNFDVSPAHDYQRFYPESSPTRDEVLSGTRNPGFDSGHQEHQVAGPSLTPWDYFKPTTVAANDEPSISVAPRPTVVSSDDYLLSDSLNHPSLDYAAPPGQLLLSLPLSHYIERSPPLLWSPLSLTVSHTPPPFYDSHDTHLRSPEEERVARDEFTPQLDYTSDSSSDTSVSTTSSPYGWVDLEPSSPVEAFVTPHDDLPPFPTVDNSDGPLLFDLSSDANIEFAGEPLLESMRSSLKTRGAVTAHYKRKRLFLIDEDEYGERACKQRCIER